MLTGLTAVRILCARKGLSRCGSVEQLLVHFKSGSIRTAEHAAARALCPGVGGVSPAIVGNFARQVRKRDKSSSGQIRKNDRNQDDFAGPPCVHILVPYIFARFAFRSECSSKMLRPVLATAPEGSMKLLVRVARMTSNAGVAMGTSAFRGVNDAFTTSVKERARKRSLSALCRHTCRACN